VSFQVFNNLLFVLKFNNLFKWKVFLYLSDCKKTRKSKKQTMSFSNCIARMFWDPFLLGCSNQIMFQNPLFLVLNHYLRKRNLFCVGKELIFRWKKACFSFKNLFFVKKELVFIFFLNNLHTFRLKRQLFVCCKNAGSPISLKRVGFKYSYNKLGLSFKNVNKYLIDLVEFVKCL
jgi:hypothetical protein